MTPIPWLTERQRSLLCWLAIQTVVVQTGWDRRTSRTRSTIWPNAARSGCAATTATCGCWWPANRWCIALMGGWRATSTRQRTEGLASHEA